MRVRYMAANAGKREPADAVPFSRKRLVGDQHPVVVELPGDVHLDVVTN
jgi:hypothetical protein